MTSPDAVPKQQLGYYSEEMDGEHLLYRLGGKKALYLNESAALVWNLCDGQRTMQEIVDVLKQAYPESEVDFAAEVSETVDRLVQEGALRVDRPAPPANPQ